MVDAHVVILYPLGRVYFHNAWASALLVQFSGQCEGLNKRDEQSNPRFFYVHR